VVGEQLELLPDGGIRWAFLGEWRVVGGSPLCVGWTHHDSLHGDRYTTWVAAHKLGGDKKGKGCGNETLRRKETERGWDENSVCSSQDGNGRPVTSPAGDSEKERMLVSMRLRDVQRPGTGSRPGSSTKLQRPASSNPKNAAKHAGRVDPFTAFMKDEEADKEARYGNMFDRQDFYRKKLLRTHRATELELAFADDDELKDKKYTREGHKVMMNNMTNANKCRSDTALCRDARKNQATSPEVYSLKKMNTRLYVKPPTPPRPPSPPKKALVDDSLKGLFAK